VSRKTPKRFDGEPAWQARAKVLLARKDFTEFCRYVDPTATAQGSFRDDQGRTHITTVKDPYNARHLRIIGRALGRVADGLCTRLFITTPPRHWKSSICSEKFSAYYLGRFPDRSVGLGCHTEGLSLQFSSKVQERLATPEFREVFPEAALVRDRQPASQWALTKSYRFALSAFGTGTAIPGKGFNLITLDDVVADQIKAFSPAGREAAKVWYQNQLRDRLQPGGALIMVMSRWAYDDLPGWVMREGLKNGEPWEVVHLPAVTTDEDGTERALWPEAIGLDELKRAKLEIGSMAWAAKFMGDPRQQEGCLIDIGGMVACEQANLPACFQKVCRAWDLAFSVKPTADWVSGGKVAKDDRSHRYILHINRFRAKWPDAKKKIVQQAHRDGPEVPVLIECNGAQLGYYDDIRADPAMGSFLVLPAMVSHVTGKKEMRASIWASRIQDGVIHYVSDAPWAQAFLDECAYFPVGENDDQVDCVSHAMSYLGDIAPFQSESVPEARNTPREFEGVAMGVGAVRRGGMLY
jgi:predicted phage terminase large subunit-like protein